MGAEMWSAPLAAGGVGATGVVIQPLHNGDVNNPRMTVEAKYARFRCQYCAKYLAIKASRERHERRIHKRTSQW